MRGAIHAQRCGRLEGEVDLLDRHQTIAVGRRHVGVDLGDDRRGAVDETRVEADRDAQADHAVPIRGRHLHDHHVRLDDAVLVDDPGDLAETHGREANLARIVFLEQAADLRRGLPRDVPEMGAQTGRQERIGAERQPGIHGQVVETFHLVLKRGVERGRFDAAVRKYDRAAVGNGADRFVRSHDVHWSPHGTIAYLMPSPRAMRANACSMSASG